MLEITDKLADHFSGQLSKGAFVNVRKTLASAEIQESITVKSANEAVGGTAVGGLTSFVGPRCTLNRQR